MTYVLVRVIEGKVEWVAENERGFWGMTTIFNDCWHFNTKKQAQRVKDELRDEQLEVRTISYS